MWVIVGLLSGDAEFLHFPEKGFSVNSQWGKWGQVLEGGKWGYISFSLHSLALC